MSRDFDATGALAALAMIVPSEFSADFKKVGALCTLATEARVAREAAGFWRENATEKEHAARMQTAVNPLIFVKELMLRR